MAELHIGRESLDAARTGQKSVDSLLERHWREIAYYEDIPLDVDWNFYQEADKRGLLRIFTVRDGEELVGYAVYLVRHAPHYKSSLQAVQDVIFLAPEYRRGSAGLQLVGYADAMLAAEGVQLTYHHSKVKQPIDIILRRQGYQLIERVWGKRHDRRRK